VKVKPVERMFGKVYDQRRTTPEEHIEAFKNVGRLVSWKEHWPSVDPVSSHEWTGVVVSYAETHDGMYQVYRSDGQLRLIHRHRISFFTA